MDIVLPFSEDGFYRFGDIPWLIARSLVPDDESAKDWIRCVTTWKDEGGSEGQFFKRVAPEGALTDKLDACNAWPVEQIDLAREPEDRSKSKLFTWLWHELRRSLEWRKYLSDGSLVIHTDTEPLGTLMDVTRGGHQVNYERSLHQAVSAGKIAVCNSSGLPHSFPLGQARLDSVVHIDELNRWGSTLAGGQNFLMASGTAGLVSSDPPSGDFAIPLIPDQVPLALLEMPPDTMVTYSTGRTVGHTSGKTSTAGLIEQFRERIALRRMGRYSLADAARILEVEAGEDGRQMLEALIDEALQGNIAVHQPGKNATFRASKIARSAAQPLEATSGTLNNWLEANHPLITYRFPITRSTEEERQLIDANTLRKQIGLDLSRLATKEQLILAYGAFTGMNQAWFENVTDFPGLRDARKVKGRGGRQSIEPLFCPLEVMQWLISSPRRAGRPISEEKGWDMLERHFPKVYLANSVADPRPGSAG